jgi:hypothetical protein
MNATKFLPFEGRNIYYSGKIIEVVMVEAVKKAGF